MAHEAEEAAGAAQGDAASCVAPLFPLSNVFLFPGTRMPLHIFEPRYRQMVSDLLDGPGRLVLGTLCEPNGKHAAPCPPGFEAPAKPPHPSVLAIGGLAEILQHERLPDGRFYILVTGLGRVRIREAPCDRLYRRVHVTPVCETPVCPSRECLLREKLTRAVLTRCKELDALPDGVSLSQLADLLLLRLQLPSSVMSPLFSELDVEKRVLGALAEHTRRPTDGGAI
ncbi:MAG: LON peptidase substrate-binding domain-containing protein [Planctomycetes bacterium]|nr:LON peptidase substrate-binding domain-containing protein [Planctomycetota bacterium]